MAAIRVKPVEHRVQVQSVTPSRNEVSKKVKKNLFGSPKPGETDELLKKEQAYNIERLGNYKFIIDTTCRDKFDTDFNLGLGRTTTKRAGSPSMTDHFKVTKKVFKPTNRQLTLMTTKDMLSDAAEQCTPETCVIGSTNFATTVAVASESPQEATAICSEEQLSTPTFQQHGYEGQSQKEVILHIVVTNPAGKFS